MRPVAVALLLLAACAARAPAPSPSPSPTSNAEEVAGEAIDAVLGISESPYDDPALAAYVEGVGQRIAAATPRPGLRPRFHVLDDADYPGSSVVGGQVYVTRAALALLDSEAELGAVLAHEIAHGVAGHTGRSFAAIGAELPHHEDDAISNLDEQYQADQLAIGYLAASGYDPTAYLSMMRALVAATGLSVPPLSSRLARAARRLGDLQGGEIGRERFLSHLDGLLLGVDPRGLRVDGGRVVDTRNGFSFPVPPGATARCWAKAVAVFDAEMRSLLTLTPFGGDRSILTRGVLEAMKKTGSIERRSLGDGASATVGRSGDGTWSALVDIHGHNHLLTCGDAPGGPAACRRRMDGVFEGFRVVTPEPATGKRLRIRIADGPRPLGELVRSRCGEGADEDLGLWIQGSVVERVLTAGQAFKCAVVAPRPQVHP